MGLLHVYVNKELEARVRKEAEKKLFWDNRNRPSVSKVIQEALLRYFGEVVRKGSSSTLQKRTTEQILKDQYEGGPWRKTGQKPKL